VNAVVDVLNFTDFCDGVIHVSVLYLLVASY